MIYLKTEIQEHNFSPQTLYMLISVIQNKSVYFGTSFLEFLIRFFLEFFFALLLFSDTCGPEAESSFCALSASANRICEIIYSSSVINARGLFWIIYLSEVSVTLQYNAKMGIGNTGT